MIPGYTHNIINLSDTEELITFLYSYHPRFRKYIKQHGFKFDQRVIRYEQLGWIKTSEEVESFFTIYLKFLKDFWGQYDRVDNSGHKIAVECKFKRLVNPVSIPALSNLADEENMSGRYIANINMDETYKETRLMPGILADRIKV